MPLSCTDLLQMAAKTLDPTIHVMGVETPLLHGQHALFFPDAEDEAACLVHFDLAACCGSGSDARRFERLVTFILLEARKAKVLAAGQDVAAMLSSLSVD